MFDRGSPVTRVKQEMVDASREVGKSAAGMRQYDLQVRILVESAGINEFGCEEGVFDGCVDSRGQVGGAVCPAAAERVDLSIHLMKDDRQVQFLNARKDRRKSRIENIVALFDRIRQMDG